MPVTAKLSRQFYERFGDEGRAIGRCEDSEPSISLGSDYLTA
jgi:hypothetical protein